MESSGGTSGEEISDVEILDVGTLGGGTLDGEILDVGTWDGETLVVEVETLGEGILDVGTLGEEILDVETSAVGTLGEGSAGGPFETSSLGLDPLVGFRCCTCSKKRATR